MLLAMEVKGQVHGVFSVECQVNDNSMMKVVGY